MMPKKRDEEAIGVSTAHVHTGAGSGSSFSEKEHVGAGGQPEEVEVLQNNLSGKLKNPLADLSKEELLRRVEEFAHEKDLLHCLDDLRRGALVAQNPHDIENIEELTESDKEALRREKTHKWHQPFMMYFMTVLCAGSAIVQGMDQSAVNGAQEFYFAEFNITDVWLQGLLNGSPYLCSVLIGCWTTAPLNHYFGRRGVIFIGCMVSFITGIWMAFADTWYNLLIARFVMGLAIGAKSTTTPIYGAECSPANIRGALVMMWQMWTAFGIMLGFIAGVAFGNVKGLEWRLILGSTSIPPFFVMMQIYFCPESPRWYMINNNYPKAYKALRRFRYTPVQAARDVYYIHSCLVIEMKLREGKSLWKEFFTRPRNRRAAQSAFFVMFMQQFCGVNVIAYYSNRIFKEAGLGRDTALIASLGTGICNWLFAIPAVYTIDTFGRRNLLLTTFPLMSILLFFTGFSFLIPSEADGGGKAQFACVATGIYLFMIVYSPGEGPVPFTYSAEAYVRASSPFYVTAKKKNTTDRNVAQPLYIRDVGMSFATATCWGFNFIISLTWPALLAAWGPTGAFSWYACWNLFGFVYAYFCLRETKELTLEELDQVFNLSTRKHARYYTESLPYYLKKFLRKDVAQRTELYEWM
ncbi:MAG: hypothetical protein M1837_001769 [Sclerophora amabilis]|nr:MAG: hypothetical protein M1837_001769 [Sclerophora amabilis]